jgi:hypothetical protein
VADILHQLTDLKGHGFSRAVQVPPRLGFLAPEAGEREMDHVGTGAFARPGLGEARPHAAPRFSAYL